MRNINQLFGSNDGFSTDALVLFAELKNSHFRWKLFDVEGGFSNLSTSMYKNLVSAGLRFRDFCLLTGEVCIFYAESRAHIVTQSLIPIICGIGVFFMIFGMVLFMHGQNMNFFFLITGIYVLLCGVYFWGKTVVYEAVEGNHTFLIQHALYFGFFLFIVSEVMFFFGIFWAYFHSILTPTVDIGCVWPLKGIIPPGTQEIPFLNTALLISSGVSVTWVHKAIFSYDQRNINLGFLWTIVLSFSFLYCQFFEYLFAGFSFNDGVYGSVFFLATGFHGFHVFIGTVLLVICWMRACANQFVPHHHIGFECAVWYWHFVDIVWIFLFFSLYFWGNL